MESGSRSLVCPVLLLQTFLFLFSETIQSDQAIMAMKPILSLSLSLSLSLCLLLGNIWYQHNNKIGHP